MAEIIFFQLMAADGRLTEMGVLPWDRGRLGSAMRLRWTKSKAESRKLFVAVGVGILISMAARNSRSDLSK